MKSVPEIAKIPETDEKDYSTSLIHWLVVLKKVYENIKR